MERTTDKPGGRRYKNAPHNKIKAYTTEELKQAFLNEYVNLASITKTCDKLGMIRRTFYAWKETDPEFEAKFRKADEMALGVLEDEAHRRAVFGTKRPVFQGGKKVGEITEYSDTLMTVLLKARAPHKYKDRFAGELTGADGKPLLAELKIQHVHSTIPLSSSEAEIVEDIQKLTDSFKLPENTTGAPDQPKTPVHSIFTEPTEEEYNQEPIQDDYDELSSL